jgi:hypothetical protein
MHYSQLLGNINKTVRSHIHIIKVPFTHHTVLSFALDQNSLQSTPLRSLQIAQMSRDLYVKPSPANYHRHLLGWEL